MGVLKTLSNGQVLALLDPDDLGDDGDVLTRVGGSGAAFRPGGGGGASWGSITGTLSAQSDLQAALDAVTFDQALNTDDDVVFASVSIGTAPFAGTGDMRLPREWSMFGWNGVDENRLFQWDGNGDRNIFIGHSTLEEVFVHAGDGVWIEAAGSGGEVWLTVNGQAHYVSLIDEGATAAFAGSSNTSLGSSGSPWATSYINEIISADALNLNATGALSINGTPGVTDAAVVVDGVTLSFTKGILTGVA